MDADGDAAFAVSVAGAHDGDGEAVFPEVLHQQRFAGCLVARVLPVGVHERCLFSDEIALCGLPVGRGGADIDILVRAVPEHAEVAFDLEGEEADELADRVENLVTQAFFHESLVVDVSDNVPDAGGHLSRAVPQVQQPQFIAAFGQ